MIIKQFNIATPELIRAALEKSGISVVEWARVHGFSAGLVYQVLEGRRKCLRGQSHQIAVALGLKAGVVASPDRLSEVISDLQQSKEMEQVEETTA